MEIYLPVAETAVNLLLVLGLGGGIGFLSGIFGVGGGFLLTPLLIFIGITPVVAVGTATAQVLASSVSGVLSHLRRGMVDQRMGLVLVAGGFAGAALGTAIFTWMRTLGVVDTFVNLSYVLLLGLIGVMMGAESLMALLPRRRATAPRRLHRHGAVHRWPLRLRFPRSGLYISSLVPLLTGFGVGILTATMGVGGGIILIPAMIYLIGMPTAIVVGTSLFQLCFVAAFSTLLHAVVEQSVDLMLALLLIVGGVIGAQLGAQLGSRLRGEQLRILLALLVLSVCLRLVVGLVAEPADVYSIGA